MERKLIGKENLANLFAKDDIKAASILRDALMDVKEKTGDITDPHIKKYNAVAENEYLFDISLTTIKNYSEKYGYGVFNEKGDKCVVKQFTVNDYMEIKEKLDNDNNVKGIMDNKKSVPEILAMNFVSKSESFKYQSLMSIRCSKSVQARMNKLCSDYSMFNKQYILSMLLDMSLEQLGYPEEK